jgi:hypothetical protein
MIFGAVTKSPKFIIVTGFTKWQNAEHYFLEQGGGETTTKTLREGEDAVHNLRARQFPAIRVVGNPCT